MKKTLLIAAGLACVLSAGAFADCVCGTSGCEKCDSAENYLEDVGKHLKKQAKKIHRKASVMPVNCEENMPSYWEEEVAIIGQNASIILDYAEMLDDEVVMTPKQKQQAKVDALKLKDSGQKIKEKAVAAKQQCQMLVSEYEEVDEYVPVNMNKMKSHKHKKHANKAPYAETLLIESMESNGDMLIQTGDFILENIAE